MMENTDSQNDHENKIYYKSLENNFSEWDTAENNNLSL